VLDHGRQGPRSVDHRDTMPYPPIPSDSTWVVGHTPALLVAAPLLGELVSTGEERVQLRVAEGAK
jgi:hypothetical protein